MNLKEGHPNHRYIVKQVKEELKLELHLQALGLTNGTQITILNNDKKGSMTIRFRGTRFAIGSRIASHIMVEEVLTEEVAADE